MNLNVTPAQLPEVLRDMARSGLVPYIQGSPGVGKSQCVEQFAKENNLYLIDIRLSQMESVDLNGYPILDMETKKMIFAPSELFVFEGEKIPDSKGGIVLFLDELPSATRTTIAGAYKLIHDRKVGECKLHPKTIIITAGNLKSDGAIMNEIGSAMRSRLTTLTMKVSNQDWINWAIKADIDHRIVAFIKFKPDMLHKFDPKKYDNSFPSPRTWEFVSKYIKPFEEITHLNMIVIAGMIEAGAATMFKTYCNIYKQLPTIEDIVADPEGFYIKDEPSHQHALTVLFAYNLEHHPKEMMIAIRRLPIEFQAVSLREAITRTPSNEHLQEVDDWCEDNQNVLF